MKTLLTLALAAATALLAVGCAQMGTVQSDENNTTRFELDPTGRTNAVTHETRTTRTRAKGTAVGKASSTFEGLDIGQNGGDQGLKVKKAEQKSDMDKFFDMLQRAQDMAAAKYGFSPPQTPAPIPAQPPTRDAPPPGMKWILAPKDEPSKPQPEEE